jgi:hypothetical protein
MGLAQHVGGPEAGDSTADDGDTAGFEGGEIGWLFSERQGFKRHSILSALLVGSGMYTEGSAIWMKAEKTIRL